MRDFVAGKHGLSVEIAKELMEKISSIQLQCQFLVCGFDSDRKGHIFSVTDPGVARFEDIPGFSAIGSGLYRAMSSLFYYPYSTYSSEAIAFYHVCEAKFMAESAMGVGSETLVFRFIGNNSYKPLFDASMESIKQMWRKEGSPRLPSKAEEKMEEILKKNDDLFRAYNDSQEKKEAARLKNASATEPKA